MFKLYFDCPRRNDVHKYYIEGSSPRILKKISGFLDSRASKTAEIYASLYLFNNPVLHENFKELAGKGVKVNVISIPLEGYDATSQQEIFGYSTGKKTKYDLAEEIYQELTPNSPLPYKLYIFPHMYIRSKKVRKFSRGLLPYSLHLKSFYLSYRSGGGAVILTSSNLACRDEIKYEVMVIIENEDDYIKPARQFFSDLLYNSIPISTIGSYSNWASYQIKQRNYCPDNRSFFIAPFYEDSPEYAEKVLKELISGAQRRILICAEHLSAYQYSFEKKYKYGIGTGRESRKGVLYDVISKGTDGLEIKFISQTTGQPVHKHLRSPQNPYFFNQFNKRLKASKQLGTYKVSNFVHCKFIIVDDTVVFTSCNFTPTQFIYLKYVDIPEFEHIPGISYRGIHSEVGQYLIITDQDVCNKTEKIFNWIWDHPGTHYLPGG